MDTEAGGPPGCSRGGGHLPEGCYDVAAVPQQGPNRLHLPFQLSNALQKAHYVQLQPFSCTLQPMLCKACYVQLHFSADVLQGILGLVALFSNCPARHATFNCSLQQMRHKAF